MPLSGCDDPPLLKPGGPRADRWKGMLEQHSPLSLLFLSRKCGDFSGPRGGPLIGNWGPMVLQHFQAHMPYGLFRANALKWSPPNFAPWLNCRTVNYGIAIEYPKRPALRWSRWKFGVWRILLPVSRRLGLARICSVRSAPKHAATEFASILWRWTRTCRQCTGLGSTSAREV
jgi:hypothetical protein